MFWLLTPRNVVTVTRPGAECLRLHPDSPVWQRPDTSGNVVTLWLVLRDCATDIKQGPTPPRAGKIMWQVGVKLNSWQSFCFSLSVLFFFLDYFQVSLYCMFSDRQTPNQSGSPLSAGPSVIPQIQSRITSEKIKIIQFMQTSCSQQQGIWIPLKMGGIVFITFCSLCSDIWCNNISMH